MIRFTISKQSFGLYHIRVHCDKHKGQFIANTIRQAIISFYKNTRCVGFRLNDEHSIYNAVPGIYDTLMDIRNAIQNVSFVVNEEFDFTFEGKLAANKTYTISDFVGDDNRIKYFKNAALFKTSKEIENFKIELFFRNTNNVEYLELEDTIQIIEFSPFKNILFNPLNNDYSLLNIQVHTFTDIDCGLMVKNICSEIATMFTNSEFDSVDKTEPYKEICIEQQEDFDIEILGLSVTLYRKLKSLSINTIRDLVDNIHTIELTKSTRTKLIDILVQNQYIEENKHE